MYQFMRVVVTAALLVSVMAACKKRPPVMDPVPENPTTTSQPTRQPENQGGGGATMPSGPSRAEMVAEAVARFADKVYFEFDMATITSAEAAKLDTKIAILRANPSVRVRIEGHCDSRGSDEYNLALGQRRANAAKAYMVARGIAESRIEIVSYGESQPDAMGENDGAWARNRRDQFVALGTITYPIGG